MRNSIVSLFLSYLLSWVALSLANSIVKDECPNTLPQLFKALRDLGYDLADAHSRSSIAGQGCIPAVNYTPTTISSFSA